MKTEKLMATLQKDYYGKALVKTMDNGDIILQSYDTDVCGIIGGEFIKMWNGYSTTTMKHINDFRMLNGFNSLSKKEWDNIDCESTEKFIVKFYNGFVEWGGRTIFDSFEDADSFGEEICNRQNWRIAYDIQQIA